MKIRFWKRPRYFDFARHRKPQVILYELFGIGTAIASLLGLTTSVTTTTVATGAVAVSTSLTAFGAVVATVIDTALLIAGSMALSTVASALTTKSGKQSPLSVGGLLLYRRPL